MVNYCAFLFSQPLSFSRTFESNKKSVPISIINKHRNYFHVLRYNKVAHDFTLERRNKPAAEIISFTPLKLDIINADWFNYENLDYILYEYQHKVYFVFEKVLNNRREVFLKVIDTTGKSSEFISLAVMDRDKSQEDFKFEYKITGENKVLVVGTQSYPGNIEKKSAVLFDLVKLEKIWVKRLPVESRLSGYSQGFECNPAGDLFYMLSKPVLAYYKRKYIDHMQVMVPVFSHESVCVAGIPTNSLIPVKKQLLTDYFTKLYSVSLQATDSAVYASFHFSGVVEQEGEKVFFMNLKWNKDLSKTLYDTIATLNEKIEKQLTFYDGSDFKDAKDKEFSLLDRVTANGFLYILSERKEIFFYKELLLIKVEIATGVVLSQQIIPRKVFYYKDRTRFKNLGLSSRILCKGNYGTILSESSDNLKTPPGTFDYHDFSKVGAAGGNLVLYSSKAGEQEKKMIYENAEFDYIPMYTQTEGCDFVFYLNRGKYEKFAILNLNP